MLFRYICEQLWINKRVFVFFDNIYIYIYTGRNQGGSPYQGGAPQAAPAYSGVPAPLPPPPPPPVIYQPYG